MTNRDSFGHLRALASSPHRAFRTVALVALMAGTIAFPATALGQDKNPLPNTTEQAKPATQDQAKPDNSKGAKLYERYCALCHGADREGYAADHSPSLRSPELMGSAPGG
ncbi:MAG: c-type cytochrome, partial [Myxococcota bacterium]|nr:c-type cytochrome [Myxococcota bacterium]